MNIFADGNIFNIISVISLVFTVVAFVLSFYFFAKTNKTKRPNYAMRTVAMTKDTFENIKPISISCAQKDVTHLSITKFLMWNEGTEIIRRDDVPPRTTLRLTIKEGYEIIHCNVDHQSEELCGFRAEVSEDKKSVEIDFNYFAHDEGVIIKVFHTGLSSDDFKLKGGFMGAKIICRCQQSYSFASMLAPGAPWTVAATNRDNIMLGRIFYSVGIGIIAAIVCMSLLGEPSRGWILSGALLLTTVIVLFVVGHKLQKRVIPKTLNKFDREP